MLAPPINRPHAGAPATLKPLPLWQALLLFLIPAILFRLVLDRKSVV